jgi:hypothetical protein
MNPRGRPVEEELLELRLQVAALQRDVDHARERADVLELGEAPPEPGRLAGLRRRVRPDVLAAEGFDVAPGSLRLPLAGLHGDGAPPRWHDHVRIDGVGLPALALDAPGRLAVRLRGGAGLRARAFCALAPGAWKANRGGVRFVLAQEDPAGREIARAQRTVDPGTRPEHRRWLPLELPLRGTGESIVVLRSELADGAEPDYAWALWGDPVLLDGPADPRAAVRRWLAARAQDALPARRRAPAAPGPDRGPLISLLLPVHDPEPALLARTLASVREQTSARWQLCVCDDGSTDPEVRALLDGLEVVRHDTPQGISAATNAALGLARGAYVATLDHDDVLDAEAIATVGARLAAEPAIDVLYTDNDKRSPEGRRFSPALKPGWSPDLLRALMYTLHLGVYRRTLVQEIGGWRPAFDGAQDHDLVLRLSERTDRIAHLPRTLYSWTAHEGSAALADAAKPRAAERGLAAVQEHLERRGAHARAEGLAPGRVRVVWKDPGLALRIVAPPEVRDAWPADDPDADAVLVLEEACVPAGEGWRAELLGPLADGAAAVGAWVVDRPGRTVHAGVAHPRGVPLPVHPGATEAEELTFVTNRSALTGAVALRAADHDPARDLLATTLALRGRKLLTPHARFTVAGTPRGTVADPARLRALGDLGPDPLYNAQLWGDRAAHVVPRRSIWG